MGIYLPEDVFTHGQLYVAFSRVQSSSAVAVYVNNKDGFTKNIVYQEVLESCYDSGIIIYVSKNVS